MVKQTQILILAALIASGCATPKSSRSRVILGIGIGAGLGATGGVAFSPNDESRAINALVFGLAGALIGGSAAVLTSGEETSARNEKSFRERELGLTRPDSEYTIAPHQDLPPFLKNRVQPVVIEEYVETDRVTEEGTLHEPHKAYRIKRPAELFARPQTTDLQIEGLKQ